MALRPGKYYINSPLRLTSAFMDDAGDNITPDTVTFKTMSPSGVAASYVFLTDDEVQQLDDDSFAADITPDEAGRWRFRWETTGTGMTFATEGDFLVMASDFYDDTNWGYLL